MSKQLKTHWYPVVVGLVCLLSAGAASAAVGDHMWSHGYGNVGGEVDVAVDGTGHSVSYGDFFGTIDFGGGPLTSANIFAGDQFLVRLDADGNHVWSQQFTPTGFGVSNKLVTADAVGNIYLTGRTANGATVDFGGGPLPGNALFLAKLNSAGVFQWSSSFGDGTATDLATDGAHVVITGYTNAGIDFGGGTVGDTGGNDIFVAQLTSAGAHVWSAGYGDTDEQGGFATAIDGSGNVLVAGTVFGTVDFGGGSLTANGADLFLASFGPTGAHNWSQVFTGQFSGGGGILVTCSLAIGPADEVALTGEMHNAVDFGGGILNSNGFGDAFCAVFGNDGTHSWSRNMGSITGSDVARGVGVDSAGNVLVTGTFAGDTDFGGGTVFLNGTAQNGNRNLFVAFYDGAGSHMFSAGYGSYVYAGAGLVGSGDHVIVYGGDTPGIDLGGGSISPADFFIARLDGATGGGASAVDETPRRGHPLAAYPNPFNPQTTISYTVPAAARVSVTAYDVRGRRVADLVPERRHEAGRHEVRFTPQAAGVYLVRLRVDGSVTTLKTVAVN